MADPCNFHDLATLTPDQRAALMKRADSDIGPFLDKVRPILAAVKAEGDKALSRFEQRIRPRRHSAGRHPRHRGRVRRGLRRARPGGARGDRVRDQGDPQLPRGAASRADVVQGDQPRRLCRRPLAPDPLGRPLRAARQGLVPVGDDDDGGAGGGRRRAGDRDLHPAGAGRHDGRRRAGRGADRRRVPHLQGRRQPGDRRRRLRHRDGAPREQDRRAGQPVDRRRQAAPCRRRRCRAAGRAVGGDRLRRRQRSTAASPASTS